MNWNVRKWEEFCRDQHKSEELSENGLKECFCKIFCQNQTFTSIMYSILDNKGRKFFRQNLYWKSKKILPKGF